MAEFPNWIPVSVGQHVELESKTQLYAQSVPAWCRIRPVYYLLHNPRLHQRCHSVVVAF